MEVTVTENNFQKEVISCEKPVLIDFWASWCGPCKMLSPVLHQIAVENTNVKVCKVNVDEENSLASKFGVSSIPMLILMDKGKIIDTSIGFMDKDNLELFIKKAE